jgi:choline dehydrogenase
MNHHIDPLESPNDTLMERLERALIAGRLNRRGFIRAATAAGFGSLGLSALADELDAMRANQNERSAKLNASYDYVVVGAGSAACALVGRLATRKDASILMIEAGDWDTAPSVLDPSVWFTNLGTERDWGDIAIASPSTNNRAIPEHMGRVVGGGSSINATIWARPFKNDLEFWAKASGDKAWGYESGLEVYRRMENWQGKPDARYRGKNGPVWCQPAHNPHPVANGLLQACKTLGYPVLDDQNGQREEGGIGFALMNQIIRDGRRQSMARSYLYPVLSRPNVTVVVNTHVDKLALSGTKVTGVHINRGGTQSVIGANTEVIICSGGINTPKLLMALVTMHSCASTASKLWSIRNKWARISRITCCTAVASLNPKSTFLTATARPMLRASSRANRLWLHPTSTSFRSSCPTPPMWWPNNMRHPAPAGHCAPVWWPPRAVARSSCARPIPRIAPSWMHVS